MARVDDPPGMATMPPDDAPVEVASNVDVTQLGLSHEEGFLLSRAFGRRQPLKELLLPRGHLLLAVSHLADATVLICALGRTPVVRAVAEEREASPPVLRPEPHLFAQHAEDGDGLVRPRDQEVDGLPEPGLGGIGTGAGATVGGTSFVFVGISLSS